MAKSVVILGSGIIGLCSAYELAKRGVQVTVVDRRAEERDGCSFGNAGMIVPSHFVPLAAPGMVALGLKWMWNPESPFYIQPRFDLELAGWAFRFWRAATRDHVNRCAPLLRDLSFASRAAYEQLSASMDFGLVTRGLIMLCKEPQTLDEEGHTAEQAKALGIAAEVLDASGVAKLDPAVTMDVAGGVYFPRDCHLSPEKLMGSLKASCVDAGVRFLWNTEITGWRREGASLRAAATTNGDIEADEFVLAGGSWSPETVASLGLRIPMQAGKGYSVTLPQPKQRPALCSIFTEARVAVTPMNGGLRFGGTMEIAGLNEHINERRVQGIIKAVPRYFPAFSPDDFAGIQPWRGLRPCSPDGMPYLGRTKAANNLVVATGHAMMGISLGPVSGQIVADLITGSRCAFDLKLMSPDRY